MKTKKLACIQLDHRYRRIGTIGEKTFFQINNFESTLKKLIGYETDDSYQYGIYARNLITWKDNCRADLMEDVKLMP